MFQDVESKKAPLFKVSSPLLNTALRPVPDSTNTPRIIWSHDPAGAFIFFFIFKFYLFIYGRAACGIFVPQPGIEPLTPAVEAQSLNHWTAREVPVGTFKPQEELKRKWKLCAHHEYCWINIQSLSPDELCK